MLEPAPLCRGGPPHEDRLDRPAVDGRRDRPDRGAVQVVDRAIDQLAEGRGLGAGDQLEGATGLGIPEREDRSRHIAHGDDVDRRRATRRDQRQRPARVRAQGCVDDVEGGGPAAPFVADDDARPEDLHREPVAAAPHEPLGLPLRELVGVVEALPQVVVELGEAAVVVTRDVGGRHVCEAPQPAALVAGLGKLEHPPGSVQVDLARLLDRKREGHGGGGVDDLVHVLGDLLAPAGVETEPRPGQIGREGHHPLRILARIREQGGERRPQPGRGLGVVARPNRRPHPAIGVL